MLDFPENFVINDERFFDSEDLMIADVFGLGLSLLFFIDKNLAEEGRRAGWNKEKSVLKQLLTRYQERPYFSRELEFIITHMLEFDPFKRPASDLLESLCDELLDTIVSEKTYEIL
jgi:hypothetical protein